MMRLFLLQPDTVFAAQVAASDINYPETSVNWENVTAGAGGDIVPGMTVLLGSTAGASDKGRQRVRVPSVGNVLNFGWSGQGTVDGAVDPETGDYITVLDDYRIWSKNQQIYVDPDTGAVTIYKDFDIAVGTYTDGDEPPVANPGPWRAATQESAAGIQMTLDGTASFAVADGATIASYLWELGSGDSFAGGTTSTDSIITGQFVAGYRWVKLTVTDSNGNTHSARTLVFVRDPAADVTIEAFEVVRRRIGQDGQRISLRVYADISAFPDGTAAILWDGEPASASDLSHMVFAGWHETDPAEIRAQREGLLRNVQVDLVDAAGRLASMHMLGQAVTDPAVTIDRKTGTVSVDGGVSPSEWYHMSSPHIDKWLHYLLYWHSTVLEVADWTNTGMGSTYAFIERSTNEGVLWDQLTRQAGWLVPPYRLTCNRLGQLQTVVHPLFQATADRTSTVQVSLTEADLSEVRYRHQRPPRVHSMAGGAILASNSSFKALLAAAPAEKAPALGPARRNAQDRLAPSQTFLNVSLGNEFARANAPEGLVDLRLSDGDDRGIEPADLTWVTVQLSAAYAAQRGLTWASARGLVAELNIRYQQTATGTAKTVDLRWERETGGPPAQTVLAQVAQTQPDTPDDFNGDDSFEDPENFPVEEQTPAEFYYGNMQMYVMWMSNALLRTDDIGSSNPVWEFITGSITGSFYDGEYVIKADNTVGMWVLTSTGVWWCDDILAVSPTFTQKLSLTDVEAVEGAGNSAFGAMAQWHANPGYLIVGTRFPDSGDFGYDHAYFWMTEDFGDTWTYTDMNGFIFENLGETRAYHYIHTHGLTVHNSSGTVFAARRAPRVGTVGRHAIFKSTDFGVSWTKEFEIEEDANQGPVVLKPFPSLTDPTYMVSGHDAYFPVQLSRSTDEWATGTAVAGPGGTPYFQQRPNTWTDDPDHILMWWGSVLYESTDQGANWTAIWAPGYTEIGTTNGGASTPNGWPPDHDQWVVVRTHADLGDDDGVVAITYDNFATVTNREGNLISLLPGAVGDQWKESFRNSGFALPRLGRNA